MWPGVSEKSMSVAELAHAADDRVLVLGDEAEPLVVGVEEHALAGLACRRGISFGTPASSSTRDHTIAVRVAKRGASSASSCWRCSARAGARRRSARRRRARAAPSARAQRRPVRVLRPPRSGSSRPASRTGGSSASMPVWSPCRAGAAARASPSTSSASDANIAPPSSSDVHSSWPSPVRALVVQRGEAADDREHRVRGVGHAEAEVERRVALAHRTRLVLEPGRRLEERVEAAEVRERTFEPVRPRVAVDDVGVDALAVVVRRCRAASRRPRSCCGARCRPARRARSAISCPRSVLRLSAMSRLPRWQPKNGWFAMRMPSPVTGSTLITSAPRSPMIIGPNGPARYWPKSIDDARLRARASRPPPRVNVAISAARVAELAEDLVVVLPGRGPRTLDRARRAEQVDRHADLRRRARARDRRPSRSCRWRRAAGAAAPLRAERVLHRDRSPRSRGCSRGTRRSSSSRSRCLVRGAALRRELARAPPARAS